MPRKAIDFNKNLIYKLVCNDLKVKDLYVGHTTDFTNRKRLHKACCLNPTNPQHNFKVYKMIRDNGSWNNWAMIEIEKFACKDENEARARERYWYEELQATMNSQFPILYAGEKKQYHKDYRENNKDKIKDYRENNKDKIKDYRDQNKDKIDEYQKDYREKNIEKIKVKVNEKHQCICGGCFTTANKSAHNKTKKHLKYIQENESD